MVGAKVRVAKLVHELLPERGAALLEQLGANAQRAACRPVPQSPAAELREHGHELDSGLRQAVARPLPGSGVLAGEQAQLDESPKPVGEDIGSDPLFRAGLQFPEIPAVSEDDVTEDEQAPAITEHLDGGIDRAPRPRLIRFAHTACILQPADTTFSISACKPQPEGATLLKRVAEGVLIHESEFVQSNAVVVQGSAGVLLIDPGVHSDEMADLANDLRELGQPVVGGFSTHPHWDHLLWHAGLGAAPRYGTARCAAAAREEISGPDWQARSAEWIPPDIAEHISWDLLGRITGLPAATARIPWDGPQIRIIEHRAHAPGHAALLIEERGVLVAGDMLSDVLIPMLNLDGTADPVEDYLAGLQLLEGAADDVDVLIPGHGSVGGADQAHARIELDRAYLHALRDAGIPDDPRLGPSAYGKDFLPFVHTRQAQILAERTERDRTPG
jgi:glyoxylase-like metal-dependent hydrolase (beta-lactamase superfamily II)